jgi:hypothetical protein
VRRLAWILLLVVATSTLAAQSDAACRTRATGVPRLDHAIVVVRNLDSASNRFGALGFRFKPGRLHPDSLLNRHIKFRDRTELELMILAGAPTDRMAKEYAALLATGEKGVYAALWVDDLGTVRTAAKRLDLVTRSTTLGPWEFLSLPTTPGATAIFFGAGGVPPVDPDSVLDHPNQAVGLEAAWVEAGPSIGHLLEALGSTPGAEEPMPDGRVGSRWALGSGSIVLVPVTNAASVPRVIGVEVKRVSPKKVTAQLHEPIPGFWLVLR